MQQNAPFCVLLKKTLPTAFSLSMVGMYVAVEENIYINQCQYTFHNPWVQMVNGLVSGVYWVERCILG